MTPEEKKSVLQENIPRIVIPQKDSVIATITLLGALDPIEIEIDRAELIR